VTSPEALRAIRSWYRLQQATAAYGSHLHARSGATGEQLALLRIIAERPHWPLSGLRARLTMHPATLGQAVDRLAQRGDVSVSRDATDRRRRIVAVTAQGSTLLASLPDAGPVRLRAHEGDTERLERLADAFDDAIRLFGLEEWAP
jgi:DNA-binding MarR family transcriptional regulator